MLRKITLFTALMLLLGATVSAQNPIIRDQFTADPSALVVGDRVFVFPSHDIPAPDDFARKDWFCMADYHVFSSTDLVNWTDHGVILDQKDVPWGDPKGYSMWAPDCAFNKNTGKYHFFFPDGRKPQGEGRRGGGFGVGVAVAENPEGPYAPGANALEGVFGIDPCIFLEDNGDGYLVMPGRGLSIAKLNDDWTAMAEKPTLVSEVPKKGLVEGPYLFKANGRYYMTFPWARTDTEVLAYCMSDNLYGPYKFMGVFFEEWPNKCWTNHHSIINFKGQWYIFYHHNDYSPSFDKNRSACVDSLFFEPDGRIKMVKPTLRGVGVTSAASEIQIDRYSAIGEGATIDYKDTTDCFQGWETIFNAPGSWVRYNTVDFAGPLASAVVKVKAPAGGSLLLQCGEATVATVKVPKCADWKEVSVKVKGVPAGVANLTVKSAGDSEVRVDWVKFVKK